MTVVEVGCAMGFFSIPMAGMVGPDGRVVCVDIQEKMLHSLKKAGGKGRRGGGHGNIGCASMVPWGWKISTRAWILSWRLPVVHEVSDPARLFAETFRALKPGARFFLCEPAGHVSHQRFSDTVAVAHSQRL